MASVAAAPPTGTAVSAQGDGVVRDVTPPQRRFRVVSDGRGGVRVIEESNVLALPGTERPTRIPDPEIVDPPPSPSDALKVIEVAPPR